MILIIDDDIAIRTSLSLLLKKEGFDGWISIEDGENGMDELRESVRFLRGKMAEHFGS